MIMYAQNLWILIFLIPVSYLFVRNFRYGKQDLFLIGGEWRKHELYDVYLVKWFFSFLVFIFFIVFIVLSIVGVSHSRREISKQPSSVDVVFTLDISRSMLCEDILPNRLQKSIDFSKEIVGQLTGNRYGIVIFKGSGVQVAPVTEDRDAVLDRISSLSPGLFTSRGTNIENGIKVSATSFSDGNDRKRFIILFTDGENLTGKPENSLSVLKEQNIKIIVIGTGSREGKELKDSQGKPIVTANGKAVISKLNSSMLKYIASVTGGYYFDISDPGTLADVLKLLSSNDSRSGIQTVQVDSYLFFLSIGLVFLLFSITIRIFPWKGVF